MQSAMPKLKSLVGIFFSSGASLISWVTTEVATVAPELVSNEFHVNYEIPADGVYAFTSFLLLNLMRF